MEFAPVPDGWDEVAYETSDEYYAAWESTDGHVTVDVESNVAGSNYGYTIVATQHVEADGLETDVQTHVRTAENRERAEQTAVEFMTEVNDGRHVLRAVGYDTWNEFVQFYCVYEDTLPDVLDVDDLIEAIDAEDDGDDTVDVPDDASTVTIDIFPRHKTELSGYDES